MFRHSENLENFCEWNEQINFLVIQNLFKNITKFFSFCVNKLDISNKIFYNKIAKNNIEQFYISMNLIDSAIIKNNLTTNLRNWADSVEIPSLIDSVTFDLYDSNNPFKKTFTKDEIHNTPMRILANTGTTVGSEFFSAFTNPYYLTHKVTQVPVLYQSVVNTYKNATQGEN